MKPLRSALLCLLCAAGLAHAAPPTRVVGLGGAVTEIIYALDAEKTLVGADASSIYPAAALKLPKVGYYRAVSVEGLASLKPDLVLAADQAGPPQALEQIRKLGSKVVTLPSAPTLAALDQRILGTATALEMPQRGRALVDRLHAELRAIRPVSQPVRVLIVSSHTGKMQGMGTDTAGDAMLALAGGTNVLAGQSGFKPFSAEAAAALKPDVIVTTTMSVGASGSAEAFLAQPGLNATPAARNRRIVVMDDLLLLGFGPRLPEAIRQLQTGLAAPQTAAR
ncbi:MULTISPECIES: hemin ABC transporter substrate-binding protein [unclassified Cupriavidus]|uniref:heme/hemin ABC transporter substrate-binding protein n=1 Tax=unclassified Cupriavidus TaxID=2640874 RepID=UPI001BFFF0E3|nr:MULTISPECIES: hemin ABC transporter substrate-binding protein [unclassified Cupriavidus]MCA3187590.1 hemin ABC transporter substrate-binding protein [Cupriavidus sp.]MCA3193782.1 hemin ABC transporter substrate-binding protein [Cupriavidus sp.]MCA3196245.1 hemin ABC transporter substrate-binding protein [Cupriavidus sp.]MCA3203766.1 hemin ABC transporter substrate-binding protein [Cupriavidus sp.]MCA3205960.1 hemin ABC transporter substrate-binding protein [Cupriavidus sp.]